MKLRLVLAISALLVSTWNCSQPSSAFDMGLSPARVDEIVPAGTEKTIVYSLVNGSTISNLRVQVLVYDWTLDEHGNLTNLPPGQYPFSASNWVEISPAEFLVKPRQTQLVRVTYKVPPGTKPGDYLTSLLFRQRVIIPPAKQKLSGQVIPEGLIGSLTYINVPIGEKKPTLESMKFVPPDINNPGKIQWFIKNAGNTHVRPSGNISIKDGDKTLLSDGLKDMSVILRDSTGVREFPLRGLAPGKYTAELNLDLDPEQYKYEKGTLNFDLPAPPKPPAPAAAKPAAAKPTTPAAKPGASVKPVTKPASKPAAKASTPAAKPSSAKAKPPASTKPAVKPAQSNTAPGSSKP